MNREVRRGAPTLRRGPGQSPDMTRSPYARHGKPLLDLAALILLAPLLVPLAALVAFAVLLVDGRPVLYRQARAGRYGTPFVMLKFRTLKEERVGIMVRDDCPDLTRLGGFLRRTGLDELPQAVNVLCGEMSLVGPRPVPLDHPTLRDARYRRRLVGKPGITGPAQLAGRSGVPWPERLGHDLAYLGRPTLAGDLALLARTALALLARKI